MNLIKRFGRKILLETNQPGVYDDKGQFVKGRKTVREITCSVQPLPTDELMKLPEGQRNKDAIKVYSTVPINVTKVKSGKTSDVVIVDGKRFEVFAVTDFMQVGGTMKLRYYRADCISEDEGA
jgi:hypothetical protein